MKLQRLLHTKRGLRRPVTKRQQLRFVPHVESLEERRLLTATTNDSLTIAPEPIETVIIDQGDTGYSESGFWSNSGLPGFQGSISRFSSQTSARANWKPALDVGHYSVSVFRVIHANSTSAAQFQIHHAGVLDTITVDFRSDQSGWVDLGTFQFDGNDQENIVLSNAASGVLRSDAVRWTLVDGPPPGPSSDPPSSDSSEPETETNAEPEPETSSDPDAEPTTNTTIIVDHGDAGYSESGSWSNSGLSGYQGSTSRFSSDARAQANWIPTLKAGLYSVSVFRVTHSNSTNAARFDIHHAGVLDTATIDLRSGQSGWVELGTFQFDGSDQEYIKLSNAASSVVQTSPKSGSLRYSKHRQVATNATPIGVLRADAVRWTLVDATPASPTSDPPSSDSAPETTAETDSEAAPETDSDPDAEPATNTSIIADQGDADQSEAGPETDSDPDAEPATNTTIIADQGDADQSEAGPETDSDPDAEPATNTTFIVDQGDAGYSESGSWFNSGLPGYQGLTSRFSSDSRAQANWIPTLNMGHYAVAVYRVTHSNSTGAAQFDIHHAGIRDTLTIDLRSGYSGWVELGTFQFDGNGQGSVVLSNAAAGVLRADAVRWTLVDAPPPVEEVARVDVHAGDEESFRETMRTPNAGAPSRFYVYPDAVLDEGLDIINRQGDEIHFLGGAQVTAEVQTQSAWSDDRGVVNIVGSSDLVITGLRATNTFQYQAITTPDDQESSTALNIARSRNISIESAYLKGLGKSALWIHGDSIVDISDTTIDAYYFGAGIGASTVSFSKLTFNQFNPVVTGDRHSTFWVSSSMRASNNLVYKNTRVVLEDTTINFKTGRAVVSGNGSYDAYSHVSFRGNTSINATNYSLGKALGWANLHSNYHGFTIQVSDNYPRPTRDLVLPTDDGEFGRFMGNTYGGGGRSSSQAPISFCEGTEDCVTSDEVLGVIHPIDLVHGGLNTYWIPVNPTQLSTDANGDLQAAYSAAYEAVIINTAIEKIDMSQATQLRIRTKVEAPGEFRFQLSFVDEANHRIDPVVFTVTGGSDWQTLVVQLSDAVRQAANKIIVGSYGNSQDVLLEVSEVTIVADGTR